MRFPKTNHFHNIYIMKMLNAILNFIGYYLKIIKNFIFNDKLNDCTEDSKDQESIQLSITSDKGHHVGK